MLPSYSRVLRRRLNALFASLVLLAAIPSLALAQTSVLQGGSFTPGHVPAYSLSGSSWQPIVIDSGPAGGNTTGQGLSELNITSQCTTPPCSSTGTGQGSAHFQIQDAVSTNSTGYHFLSFDANAGGGGLINYGAAGGASALPLNFKINGTTYTNGTTATLTATSTTPGNSGYFLRCVVTDNAGSFGLTNGSVNTDGNATLTIP